MTNAKGTPISLDNLSHLNNGMGDRPFCPFPSGQREIFIIAVFDFTKWMEAKPLEAITESQASSFSGSRLFVGPSGSNH